MTRTKSTILLLVFTILTLVSIITVYSASQIPLEEKTTVVLCNYQHTATYDYTAILQPNIIYNQSTLKPGEGTIYTRITDQINTSLTYSFESTLPANVTVQCDTTQALRAAGLTKQLSKTPTNKINTTGTSTEITVNNIKPLEINTVKTLVNSISQEAGISITQYDIIINATIHIKANTAKGIIDETFTPSLTFSFKSGIGTGQLIAPSDLQHTKTGSITETQTIRQDTFGPWVTDSVTLYLISLLLSTVSFSGLAYSIYAFRRTKPSIPVKQERFIEDIVEPYEYIIAKTNEEPSYKGQTPIAIESLEDLAKIADILGKPILHAQKPPKTHVFYLIDGTTIYRHTTTAQCRTEQREREIEEENEK